LTDVPSGSTRGWYPLVREPFAGAWQRNMEWRAPDLLAYAPVYACVTLIANDIAKCRMKLVQETQPGIWEEFENPAYSPVLRKPNHFQTRIEFYKSWMFSRLLNGNTYVLKVRDQRRVVTAKYVLDPQRVRVLVAPNGEVFYSLSADNLSGLTEAREGALAVPASEIIHDKHDAIYHPLVGISPLTACYLAALQALGIVNDSSNFFANGSNPGGVLTAPGFIKDETAKRLKEYWDENFSGMNAGKVAVLGDGLKYEAMRMTATDAQLIEQLKWTALDVCTAFHVPPYKIGVGPYPPYNNIEALNVEYYSQALQSPIESIELLEDEGMSLPNNIGVEFDLDALLRMDTSTRMNVAGDAVGKAVMTPNESRKRFFGLAGIKGGDTIYMQEQNFSLEALAERDKGDPFAKAPPPQPEPTPPNDSEDDMPDEDIERAVLEMLRKEAA
jgi:HK97 family phage portal protein